MAQNLFTLFPRALTFFMNFRVASLLLYSSYRNNVMMGKENWRVILLYESVKALSL